MIAINFSRIKCPVLPSADDKALLSFVVTRGIWHLNITLDLSVSLSEDQRQDLLNVANKCPAHRLMTQVTTEVTTRLNKGLP